MPTRTQPRTGRRTSTTTGRFARSTPSTPAGRFGSVPRRRAAQPAPTRFGRRQQSKKTGIAGLASKLPMSGSSLSGKKSSSSKKRPALAALAGIGGLAAAFAKRKRSSTPEPPAPGSTYSPPAEPSIPATPVGAGNGTSTS